MTETQKKIIGSGILAVLVSLIALLYNANEHFRSKITVNEAMVDAAAANFEVEMETMKQRVSELERFAKGASEVLLQVKRQADELSSSERVADRKLAELLSEFEVIKKSIRFERMTLDPPTGGRLEELQKMRDEYFEAQQRLPPPRVINP